MDPKVLECWNKGLAELRKAEELIRSNEEPKVIIEHLKTAVICASTAIVVMKDGESDLAGGDLFDFADEIKDRSVHDALRSAKKAFKRIRDLAPRDCYLP